MSGVGVGSAVGFHPLTPLVVGPEGEGEDEEDEDSECVVHSSCFAGRGSTLEDSLRKVRRASPASQNRKRRRSAVSMKPAMKRTTARMGWCSRR